MRSKQRLLSPKNLLALALLFFSLVTGIALIDTQELAEQAYNSPSSETIAAMPSLKADWDHILYGDETGGGHLHGTGIPCKSEFPENWGVDKVKSTVSRLAANDNADWRQEENGYIVSEQQSESLKIRVVVDPERAEIVTSYPVNVQRNPCTRE